MATVLYATKHSMGEAYLDGIRRAVTKLKLYDHQVTSLKDPDKDGYRAAVVKLAETKTREIPFSDELKVGDSLDLSAHLKPGTVVSVQGVTKGKGFAGVVKRYGFGGGVKTHGQSDRWRAPGSIGQGTTPGRVHKGKKMPGRMGGDTHTVKNALVIAVNGNELWLTGPVPGNSGTFLRLTLTGEKKVPQVDFVTGGLPATESLPADRAPKETQVPSKEESDQEKSDKE